MELFCAIAIFWVVLLNSPSSSVIGDIFRSVRTPMWIFRRQWYNAFIIMIQSLSCKETTGIDFLDNTEHYNEKKSNNSFKDMSKYIVVSSWSYNKSTSRTQGWTLKETMLQFHMSLHVSTLSEFIITKFTFIWSITRMFSSVSPYHRFLTGWIGTSEAAIHDHVWFVVQIFWSATTCAVINQYIDIRREKSFTMVTKELWKYFRIRLKIMKSISKYCF